MSAPAIVPTIWILEWGAIDLPHGHPSRVTCMTGFYSQFEALSEQKDCEFSSHIFPAAALATSDPTAANDHLPDLLAELQNIANAKRFSREHFADDSAFCDWAQSRARAAIARATSQPEGGA